jgi:hypothetical protein
MLAQVISVFLESKVISDYNTVAKQPAGKNNLSLLPATINRNYIIHVITYIINTLLVVIATKRLKEYIILLDLDQVTIKDEDSTNKNALGTHTG